MVPSADGSLIPLQQIARVRLGQEAPPIHHVDGRSVNIVWALGRRGLELGEVSLPEGWTVQTWRGRMPSACAL